ncbi:hypothetical protein [Hymenobacter cellulosivorans]|uniref:Uncharacterized protein n=1 Tax=Hymenobacter cellulosivorans TaxID=2932249 RepID=A0ABY4F8G0_9BACT|nr:hypothetical protein [Hymenobacter cellulosivorans]UOQ52945.1 hypothetical protein MUN80_24810 [Hymenobacter cellulosivorans]
MQDFRMLEIDKTAFQNNLLLTQQYCELQLANTEKNHASILRSINPIINDELVFGFNFITSYDYQSIGIDIPELYVYTFHSKWTTDPFSVPIDSVVNNLFAEQLKHKAALGIAGSSQCEGRILAVRIWDTIVDGATQGESRGFMDEYDFPPVDTWFYKASTADDAILFAWIPKQFIWLVDQAIAVNVPDMMGWFEKEYPEDYTRVMG